MNNRIDYLDGHRGLAILLVILFHGFARWNDTMPFGDKYADFPLFSYGYLGVQLFFLISGFVILMTLEKCSSTKQFIYRRWLRLFPAMLICSLLIFSTQHVLTERPLGNLPALELIPGLTFIDTYILEKIFGHPFTGLEGAFWSLYVEFKFYIFAGIFYFAFGDRVLIHILTGVFLIDWLAGEAFGYSGSSIWKIVYTLTTLASFKYFGWFAAGSAFYMFFKSGSRPWFAYGCIVALLCCIKNGIQDWAAFIANLSVACFFTLSLLSPLIQRALQLKWLQLLGFVSYPLYLIHENAMVSATIQISNYYPNFPAELTLIFSVILLIAISYVIAKHIEPKTRNMIKK